MSLWGRQKSYAYYQLIECYITHLYYCNNRISNRKLKMLVCIWNVINTHNRLDLILRRNLIRRWIFELFFCFILPGYQYAMWYYHEARYQHWTASSSQTFRKIKTRCPTIPCSKINFKQMWGLKFIVNWAKNHYGNTSQCKHSRKDPVWTWVSSYHELGGPVLEKEGKEKNHLCKLEGRMVVAKD